MSVDPYYNHYPNNLPRLLEEMKMSEIVHVYRGEYVSIDLVDSTTELTVENNISSLPETMELQQDLARGIHKLVTGLLLLKEARSE